MEDEGLLGGVRLLLSQERDRVLPPVPPRVEVVRGVVAVVVAVAVALLFFGRLVGWLVWGGGGG